MDDLQSLSQKATQLRIEIDLIHHSINSFKLWLEDLSKKPDLTGSFAQLRGNVEKFFDLVTTKQAVFQDSLKRSEEKINEMHSAFKNLPLKIIIDTINDLDKKLSLQKEEHSKKVENHSSEVSQRLKDHKDAQTKELASIRQEFITSPKSIIDSNESMKRKMDSTSLDASNAMMKVNNSDLALRYLEKRMENFELRVKKIELQAQM